MAAGAQVGSGSAAGSRGPRGSIIGNARRSNEILNVVAKPGTTEIVAVAGTSRGGLGKYESNSNRKDVRSGTKYLNHENMFGASASVNEQALNSKGPSPVPNYNDVFGVANFGNAGEVATFGTQQQL